MWGWEPGGRREREGSKWMLWRGMAETEKWWQMRSGLRGEEEVGKDHKNNTHRTVSQEAVFGCELL